MFRKIIYSILIGALTLISTKSTADEVRYQYDENFPAGSFSLANFRASLRGLSVLSGNAQVFHQVQAHHLKGHGVSRQFYKSIVADNAKAGFESLVSVEKGAAGSDSKQLNKNLILSATAQAYSRPELRISTDDVSCAHGSATGELSEVELFYLQSRGIARENARFMMIEGFAEEILEDVSYAPLKKRLMETVQKKIEEICHPE